MGWGWDADVWCQGGTSCPAAVVEQARSWEMAGPPWPCPQGARPAGEQAWATQAGLWGPGEGRALNLKPGASFPANADIESAGRPQGLPPEVRDQARRSVRGSRIQPPPTACPCPHPQGCQQPPRGWPLASAEALPVTLTTPRRWPGTQRLNEHLLPARRTVRWGHPAVADAERQGGEFTQGATRA